MSVHMYGYIVRVSQDCPRECIWKRRRQKVGFGFKLAVVAVASLLLLVLAVLL